MKLFENISAELSVEELKDLIKKAASAEMGRPVTDVKFTSHTETTGFGPGERDEVVFTGAKITFGPKAVYDGRL